MKKQDTTYTLGVIFAAATSVFYCCVRWFRIQLPRYYPLEHTWKWVKEPGVPSQGWYAMQVFAFLCAAVVTVLAYFALKHLCPEGTELQAGRRRLLGVAGTAVMVFCMAYIAFYEFSHWGIL